MSYELPVVADLSNFLVLACRSELRVISLDTGYYAQRVLPVPPSKHAVAIAVDTLQGN